MQYIECDSDVEEDEDQSPDNGLDSLKQTFSDYESEANNPGFKQIQMRESVVSEETNGDFKLVNITHSDSLTEQGTHRINMQTEVS
jgi:hypothetical protein